jgi:hypothetical protein
MQPLFLYTPALYIFQNKRSLICSKTGVVLMNTKNPAFEMTEGDSRRYLECVVLDASRAVQKIFFDCMRVARRLKIELPYRTFLAEFFKWLVQKPSGTIHTFLITFTVREVFERALETVQRYRREQQRFWRHAYNTLQ